MENKTLDNIEEIALDGIESLTEIIFDNGIVEKIPIANIASAIIKTGEKIYNKNLERQTIKFIESLNKQEISEENIKKYKEKVFKNDKKTKEEIERVLLYLNKNIDIEKSELLAKFYASYVNQKINLNKFCEYATIINIKEKLKIKQKRFEGRIINDYEIKLKNNYFGEKIVDRQYYCKDLYESELHKKTPYKELRKKIKKEIADIIIIPT